MEVKNTMFHPNALDKLQKYLHIQLKLSTDAGHNAQCCSSELSTFGILICVCLIETDPERVEKQIEKVFDIPKEECIRVSPI